MFKKQIVYRERHKTRIFRHANLLPNNSIPSILCDEYDRDEKMRISIVHLVLHSQLLKALAEGT